MSVTHFSSAKDGHARLAERTRFLQRGLTGFAGEGKAMESREPMTKRVLESLSGMRGMNTP